MTMAMVEAEDVVVFKIDSGSRAFRREWYESAAPPVSGWKRVLVVGLLTCCSNLLDAVLFLLLFDLGLPPTEGSSSELILYQLPAPARSPHRARAPPELGLAFWAESPTPTPREVWRETPVCWFLRAREWEGKSGGKVISSIFARWRSVLRPSVLPTSQVEGVLVKYSSNHHARIFSEGQRSSVALNNQYIRYEAVSKERPLNHNSTMQHRT